MTDYSGSHFGALVTVATANILQGILAWSFVIALLCSRKVRTNAFNLFVVLIVIPDAVLMVEFAVNTILKLVSWDGLTETPQLSWQARSIHDWVQMSYFVTNFYLNAVITHEILKMARMSKRFQRYDTPSISKVLVCSGSICLASMLFATWFIDDLPWGFVMVHRRPGDFQQVEEYGNDIFQKGGVIAIYFSVLSVPMVYVFGCFAYIRHNNLIDGRVGHTKQLHNYFMRIIYIFLFFYVPMFVLNLIREAYLNNKFWSGIFIDLVFPLQSSVTLCFASTKEDIKDALPAFICCHNRKIEVDNHSDQTRKNSSSGAVTDKTWWLSLDLSRNVMENENGSAEEEEKGENYDVEETNYYKNKERNGEQDYIQGEIAP